MKANRFFILCLIRLLPSFSNAQVNDHHVNATKDSTQAKKVDLSNFVWSSSHMPPSNKSFLDFETIANWPAGINFLEGVTVSPNGKYFIYEDDSLIVQSTINNWRATISKYIEPGLFSSDSKQYIIRNADGLCSVQLGIGKTQCVVGVESYKVDEGANWLAYRLNNGNNTLVLQSLIADKKNRIDQVVSYMFVRNEWFLYQLQNQMVVLRHLESGRETVFENVFTYNIDNSWKWLVCRCDSDRGDLLLYDLGSGKRFRFSSIKFFKFSSDGDHLVFETDGSLDYIDLDNENRIVLWSKHSSKETIGNIDFDGSGKQVVFVIGEGNEKSLYYWTTGMLNAEMKLSNKTGGIPVGEHIQGKVSFTDDGRYLQFKTEIIDLDVEKPGDDVVQLNVWSYQDSIIQSAQAKKDNIESHFNYVDLKTGNIIHLRVGESLWTNGPYGILHKNLRDNHDRFWEIGYYDDSAWIVNIGNGHRRLLPVEKTTSAITRTGTPDRRYFIFCDRSRGYDFFSFDFATGREKNISKGLEPCLFREALIERWNYDKQSNGVVVQLWLEGNSKFLVNDRYGDIWQLDASGQESATCITNRTGYKNNITFSLLRSADFGDRQKPIIGNGPLMGRDTLLLNAFDRTTKRQGFYRKVIGKKGNPELLSMNDCYMMGMREGFNGNYPIKATNANTWIVNRQSFDQQPDFYVTHDFKDFKQLTFSQRHAKYNWLKSESHKFKHLDGHEGDGVLYKPENFNPTKKYPVLIVFYDQFSNKKNHFPSPRLFACAMTPGESPTIFLDHGYLVFTPDIYIASLKYGPQALSVVEGAVNFLRTLPYVDGEHIGAASHSWGAKLASYIFTHSSSLAAISISEGFLYGNLISRAFSLDGGDRGLERIGNSGLEDVEVDFEYGKLWENKMKWLDQTTVLNVDKAVSPLLLYCGKKSSPDYQNQTVQLFTALRRLEKKVWWLNYDNGGHVLDEPADQKDYTIRYLQFFDHFLKQAPAPSWMAHGIPAHLKGKQLRYELTPGASCSLKGKNRCYTCEAWNKQYTRNPKMFSGEIANWKLDDDIQDELSRKTKIERKALDAEGANSKRNVLRILKEGHRDKVKKAKSFGKFKQTPVNNTSNTNK